MLDNLLQSGWQEFQERGEVGIHTLEVTEFNVKNSKIWYLSDEIYLGRMEFLKLQINLDVSSVVLEQSEASWSDISRVSQTISWYLDGEQHQGSCVLGYTSVSQESWCLLESPDTVHICKDPVASGPLPSIAKYCL